MWVGNDTKQRRFTSEWDGRTKQERYEGCSLYDAHTFWDALICVNVICLTFVNVNISVNIKSISQAMQPRSAERVNIGVNIKRMLEKSQTSARYQYGSTTTREYRG